MQISARARLTSIIIAIVFLAGTLIGSGTYLIITQLNKTDATTQESYVTTTNLFNTDGTINSTAAYALLEAVGYIKNPNDTGVYKAHQIASRNNNNGYNGDATIVFPMGYVNGTSGNDVYWQVTYLYNNYITIWMNKCYSNSAWTTSSISVNYYDYSNSTIQTELNSIYSTITQNGNSNLQTIFATPAVVGYQVLNDSSTNDTSYWYSSNTTSTFDNLSSTVGNGRYFWLPSFSEVVNNTSNEYKNDNSNYTGLWGLNAADRSFSTTNVVGGTSSYNWLRSGISNANREAILLTSIGSTSSLENHNSRGVRPAAHISLDALANLVNYNVTASSNNSAQGSATASASGDINSQIVTFTATPNAGYSFDYWMINNERIEANPYSMFVDTNTTAIAYFKPGIYINATSNNTAQGTVMGGGTYQFGDMVYLVAMPTAGYKFAYWQDEGGGRSTSSTLIFTATAGKTFTAYFTPSYSANITGTATFSTEVQCSDQSYQDTYYLTASAGNYFYGITIDTEPQQIFAYRSGILDSAGNSAGISYMLNDTATILILQINYPVSNINIYLTFSNQAPPLSNSSGGGVAITGVAVQATYGGSATILGDDIANLEDTDTITFAAKLTNSNYQFTGWYDSSTNTLLSTNLSERFTVGEIKGKVIVARFEQITDNNTNSDLDNSQADDFA